MSGTISVLDALDVFCPLTALTGLCDVRELLLEELLDSEPSKSSVNYETNLLFFILFFLFLFFFFLKIFLY